MRQGRNKLWISGFEADDLMTCSTNANCDFRQILSFTNNGPERTAGWPNLVHHAPNLTFGPFDIISRCQVVLPCRTVAGWCACSAIADLGGWDATPLLKRPNVFDFGLKHVAPTARVAFLRLIRSCNRGSAHVRKLDKPISRRVREFDFFDSPFSAMLPQVLSQLLPICSVSRPVDHNFRTV